MISLCTRALSLGQAEPLLREALTAKRESLGPRHPETLIGINQLGQLKRARLAPVEEVAARLLPPRLPRRRGGRRPLLPWGPLPAPRTETR